MTSNRPYVLVACAGLDHARRGFETFARECFEALRDRDDLKVELLKATGPRQVDEHVVLTTTRHSAVAQALARALRREPFIIEHVAFGLAILPLLTRRKPDVVYFSEWHMGRVLAVLRTVSRQRFALVLSNGALAPEGYGHLDLVQQLVPGALDFAARRGEPVDRQLVLPLGVSIDPSLTALTQDDRARIRQQLRLPRDRLVVLSVGAITAQKRMDYLVEEIASMPEPRPFLLILGQEEADSGAIRALARQRLGSNGHAIRSVAPEAMTDHYRASDAFVLASLWESFGRALVEAHSHGLPCLAHDYPVMRWILGDEGDVADLTLPGAVAGWVSRLTPSGPSDERRLRRHQSAYARFSWDILADRYASMLRHAAKERMS